MALEVVAHGPPLNLSGANFRGAQLRESRFHNVLLDRACFVESQLQRCEWVDVRADAADFTQVQCQGATFRHCHWEGSRWEHACLHHVQWLFSAFPGEATAFGSIWAVPPKSEDLAAENPARWQCISALGHSAVVWHARFLPTAPESSLLATTIA